VGKRVELTWVDKRNQKRTEQVWLASDDDPLISADGQPMEVQISTGEMVDTVGELAEGKVMFADDNGLFGVDPHKVINITILEEE
jgi:hypothetical protein